MGVTVIRGAKPAVKQPKAAPPVLDPPSGFRDPSVILAKSKRSRSYCGPWVIMAITGRSFEEVRAALNEVKGFNLTTGIMGTSYSRVRRALQTLGVRVIDRTQEIKAATFAHRETLTLARFLRERPPEDVNKAFVVCAGEHWILVKGKKVTCSLVGHWTWLRHAKKRRGVVDCVIEIVDVDKAKAREARDIVRKKLDTIKKERAIIRSLTTSDRTKALALLSKLGCHYDSSRYGGGLEITVNAPSKMRHLNGLSTETYYSWGEVVRAYSYKPEHLFEPDEDEE